MPYFYNKNNRITLSGYISQIRTEEKYIEIDLIVSRPVSVKGAKTYTDNICVYVSPFDLRNFVINNLKNGSVINVKGELRSWADGSYKVCAGEIVLKG